MHGKWRRAWDAAAHGVAYYHLLGALVSGAAWLLANLRGWDRQIAWAAALAFLYCLMVTGSAVAHHRWKSWRNTHNVSLGRWWELRRYTNAGLTWLLVGREEVDGRATATVRISPTSELPVPLKLEITCAGNLQGVIHARLHPPEVDKYGDVHIYPTEGRNKGYVTLMSPRLHPPVYLEVKLLSAGNATINVTNVKRNPK